LSKNYHGVGRGKKPKGVLLINSSAKRIEEEGGGGFGVRILKRNRVILNITQTKQRRDKWHLGRLELEGGKGGAGIEHGKH